MTQDKLLIKLDTAAYDQIMTATEQIAEILSNYYKQLIINGTPKDVAKALVIEYQKSLFPSAAK